MNTMQIETRGSESITMSDGIIVNEIDEVEMMNLLEGISLVAYQSFLSNVSTH
jgi:hypothetical protein